MGKCHKVDIAINILTTTTATPKVLIFVGLQIAVSRGYICTVTNIITTKKLNSILDVTVSLVTLNMNCQRL